MHVQTPMQQARAFLNRRAADSEMNLRNRRADHVDRVLRDPVALGQAVVEYARYHAQERALGEAIQAALAAHTNSSVALRLLVGVALVEQAKDVVS